MKRIKLIYFLTILTVSYSAFGQSTTDRQILGREFAEQELKSALFDKSLHNVADKKGIIVKDSLTAIDIAEQILFKKYGKKQIRKQLSYETYLINNYWVIFGTLPKDSDGGTFFIILDSRDSSILKITHWQ
jgi:hypothetical protein